MTLDALDLLTPKQREIVLVHLDLYPGSDVFVGDSGPERREIMIVGGDENGGEIWSLLIAHDGPVATSSAQLGEWATGFTA